MKDENNLARPFAGSGGYGSRAGTFIALFVVLLLVLVGLWSLFLRSDDDDPGDHGFRDDTPSPLTATVSISEIMPSEGWFELYVEGEDGGTLEKLIFTTYTGPPVTLPRIVNLAEFNHVVVHTGKGETRNDAAGGTAVVSLGMDRPLWRADGGEIGIYDGEKRLVDYVAWGAEGSDGTDTPRKGWEPDSYLPVPPVGRSLSLHGENLGPDSHWTTGPPSPGGFNIVDLPLSRDGHWRIYLINGRKEAVIFDTEDEGKYTGRSLSVNVSVGVPPGQPVNQTMLAEVEEYVNFTYNLLRDHGYGDALASGTDPEGRPFVNISVTAGGSYSGGCWPNGRIEVDIGPNRAASKQVVEHEMLHNFQFESGSLNPRRYWFVEEGLAEFWGRYSAMLNFNLTWQEMEAELAAAGSISIYHMTNTSWQNFFSDWRDTFGRTYHANYTSYYSMAYLFMKYLFDVYGISVMRAIHENNSNAAGANRTIGIALIENATGASFPDLLRNFTIYRLENRFPQYRNDTRFRRAVPDTSNPFDGENPVSHDNEPTEEYGSRINEYLMNGSAGLLRFVPRTNRSTWELTVIREYPNGTREYVTLRLGRGQNGTIYIPPGYARVILIKTRLTGSSFFREFFNVTMMQAPVITPGGRYPAHGDSIVRHPPWIEDPNPTLRVNPRFWWNPLNLTGVDPSNLSYRIEIDSDPTFPDPWGETVSGDANNLSFPEHLTNGTHWWRIRWEIDQAVGPWTGGWSYDLWWNPPPPDILWDPYPVTFEDRIILIPESIMVLHEPRAPAGMEVGDGKALIRIMSDGEPIVTYDLIPGDPFPIGEVIMELPADASADRVEWRVMVPPFPDQDWPWYGKNILWNPPLPEWGILSPENNSAHREDAILRIRVEDSVLDSFFDLQYQVDVGSWRPYEMEVMETGPGMFEVPLNLSEMPEGRVNFMVHLVDGYGRVSGGGILSLEVDRTPPEVFIESPDAGRIFSPGEVILVAAVLGSPDTFEDESTAARLFLFLVHDLGEDTVLEDVIMSPAGLDRSSGWSHEITEEFEPGAYRLEVRITDAAGNTGGAETEIFVDEG